MVSRIRLGRTEISLPDEVFLDTAFLLSVQNESDLWHATAVKLLVELLSLQEHSGLRMYTSVRVVDEGWWKLAQLLHEADKGRGSWNRLDRKGRKAALVTHGQHLRAMLGSLRQMGVGILGLPSESVETALDLITNPSHSLEPADAFHVAVMREHQLSAIVTNDRDFADVAGCQRVSFNFPLR